MISFGSRSILLLIGTTHGLVLAALLLRAPVNRVANRLLALLLLLVAFRVVPYIIGFAGFYDAYPWLSFMPYDWSLGYGALIWLYARTICRGVLPVRWQWHLVPAALQGLYYIVMFTQPLSFKDQWNEAVHVPRIVPVESTWTFVAMAVYLWFAWREYRGYQQWLDAERSNREEFRLDWLRFFIVTFGATLVLWVGTSLYELFIRELNYFGRFPLYLWFSVLIYGLGLLGLRNARVVYPRPELVSQDVIASVDDGLKGSEEVAPDTDTDAEAMHHAHAVTRTLDWAALGARFSAQVRQHEWWRDPELTAPMLARHLATNSTYLSRALNEGLGQNFNEFVNGIRVEAVTAELRDPGSRRDILTIALDAGFNSKASFNRVFKRVTGVTPSHFRMEGTL